MATRSTTCFIAGPPGLGKTTLAGIIATELGVGMHTTSGPALDRKVDVAGLLTNLQEGDVLFVDEIHRLNAAVEEVLYPAMEDYEIDIMIGEGPAARSIRMQVQPFTLIGATTRTGLLTTPLRDRFGVWQRLEYYEIEELAPHRAALRRHPQGAHRRRLGPRDRRSLTRHAACRQPPAAARARLRRSAPRGRDRPRHLPCRARALFQVDAEGLDKLDRDILCAIAQKFDGGPVGLDTLAVALGEESDTLMDVYEPYLIMQGFLMRTPRGRVLRARASALRAHAAARGGHALLRRAEVPPPARLYSSRERSAPAYLLWPLRDRRRARLARARPRAARVVR